MTQWRAAAAAAACALGGCGVAPEPQGTPLQQGQWQLTTRLSTPKFDGLSVDALRRQLPADRESSMCMTPVVRSGAGFMDFFNLKQQACDLATATVKDGTVAAEGQCPGLARQIATGGGGQGFTIEQSKSWIKIAGTYEPDYLKVDADIVMTVTTDRGETSRLTITASHTAERTGDCT